MSHFQTKFTAQSFGLLCLCSIIMADTSITTWPDPAKADGDTVPTIESNLERNLDPDIRDLVNKLEREQTLVAQPLVFVTAIVAAILITDLAIRQ